MLQKTMYLDVGNANANRALTLVIYKALITASAYSWVLALPPRSPVMVCFETLVVKLLTKSNRNVPCPLPMS